ncbi:serine/threonine protein kinase, partial [Streptomyces flaveolus]|uniref:protein kinase domain-containing protein n=1 Tax=Streptomyces flaveolus TaxID=67297 RepID=UPI0034159A67
GIATVEGDGDTALTLTGEVVGSPEYLAPERALGRTPGTASDLWSLGALLYTAVQGRSPFRRTTALATLRAIVDDELPPAHRAGPLAPVIKGLLLKDPEERMTADEAGRQLRLTAGDAVVSSEAGTSTDATAATTLAVATTPAAATTPALATTSATGGITAAVTAAVTIAEEVPTAAVASPETAPTVVDADSTAPVPHAAPAPLGTFGPPASGAGFGPVITEPGPVFGHGTGSAPAPVRRSRRTAYLIGAAAAVLVLLGGGLAYALVTRDDDRDKDGGAGTGGSASQPVSVTVTGNATTYDGSCPPGDGQAPWFTATFTTDRAPVQFSYRWVSENGSVVDPQWRTLSFREGDPTSKKETVRLSTYAHEGTLRSAMAVEIKSPFDARSNTVAFSITCRTDGE